MAAVQLCPLFPRTALGHHLIQSWVNQIDNKFIVKSTHSCKIDPKYEDILFVELLKPLQNKKGQKVWGT